VKKILEGDGFTIQANYDPEALEAEIELMKIRFLRFH
jgi:hypothetical protein